MTEDKFEDFLKRAAQSYNAPPVRTPREEMWNAIQAKRSAGPRVVYGGGSFRINDLKISPWRMSMGIGSGFSYLGANLNTHFEQTIPVLWLDYKVHYRRHQLLFSMNGDFFSNHSLLKSLDDNGIIRPNGLPITYTLGQAMYGYAVVDGAKWQITPCFGRGVLDILEIEPDLKTYPSTKNVLHKVDYNWVGGVSVGYKICKKIDVAPQDPYGAQFEQGIELRLAAMKVDYPPDLKGLSIIGSLCYRMTIGVVRRKK